MVAHNCSPSYMGGLIESGRTCHCTTAWVTEQHTPSKKKECASEFQAKESRNSQPRDSFLIYEEYLNHWPIPWNAGQTGD